QDPLAQGRLLAWTPNKMIVEELQIIGQDVGLRVGDRVEAYITFDNVMMTFESKIVGMKLPNKINEHRVVQSIELTEPKLLRQGDRRSAFRTSVTAMDNDIKVKMWFLDRLSDHVDVDCEDIVKDESIQA